jgi:2-polyprenyl-3-methyl-5-hydroxy-6-metoxy-1,4-benzoquinol methylase
MISDFLSRQLRTYNDLIHSSQIKELKSAIKNFKWHESYTDLKKKLKNLAKTNYDLAIHHALLGNNNDCIMRFKIAHWLDKRNEFPDTDYQIALCYFNMFKYEKAKHYLQKYQQQAKHAHKEEVIFCLNVIEQNFDQIKHIPEPIIQYKSDMLISTYKSQMVSTHINAQKNMLHALASNLQLHGRPFGNNTLDLGCGTGALGFLLRESKLSSFITGVDISKATNKFCASLEVEEINVYNTLKTCSIAEFIQHNDEKFDIILAAESLNYDCNILSIMKALHKALTKHGILALTLRTSSNNSQYEFNPYVLQFMFNKEFLKESIADAKLKIVHEEKTKLINDEEGILMLLTIA